MNESPIPYAVSLKELQASHCCHIEELALVGGGNDPDSVMPKEAGWLPFCRVGHGGILAPCVAGCEFKLPGDLELRRYQESMNAYHYATDFLEMHPELARDDRDEEPYEPYDE